MRRAEKRMREAATAAANAEVLLPTNAGHLEAEGMERTYKFRQEAIVPHLDVTSAKKVKQSVACERMHVRWLNFRDNAHNYN